MLDPPYEPARVEGPSRIELGLEGAHQGMVVPGRAPGVEDEGGRGLEDDEGSPLGLEALPQPGEQRRGRGVRKADEAEPRALDDRGSRGMSEEPLKERLDPRG